jgi:hypothetical protein
MSAAGRGVFISESDSLHRAILFTGMFLWSGVGDLWHEFIRMREDAPERDQ